MDDIANVISYFADKAKEIYGVNLVKIVLFGSYARNEASDDSDIDLLVVLKGEIRPSKEIDRMIEIIHDTHMKFDFVLQVVPIGERDFKSSKLPLVQNIRQEGKNV